MLASLKKYKGPGTKRAQRAFIEERRKQKVAEMVAAEKVYQQQLKKIHDVKTPSYPVDWSVNHDELIRGKVDAGLKSILDGDRGHKSWLQSVNDKHDQRIKEETRQRSAYCAERNEQLKLREQERLAEVERMTAEARKTLKKLSNLRPKTSPERIVSPERTARPELLQEAVAQASTPEQSPEQSPELLQEAVAQASTPEPPEKAIGRNFGEQERIAAEQARIAKEQERAAAEQDYWRWAKKGQGDSNMFS